MKSFVSALLIVLSASLLQAADSTSTKPSVRLNFQDGRPIPSNLIPIIYDKDCDPNGWRFEDIEWEQLRAGRPVRPRQYTDPVKGSNGGVDWA